MDALIKVVAQDNKQLVSARGLHEALGVKTEFRKWFSIRVEEYEFVEGDDFFEASTESTGEVGRPEKDYLLAVDRAKLLAASERNEKGRQITQYLLKIEKAWNTPELIDARYRQMFAERLQQEGYVIMSKEDVQNIENLGISGMHEAFPESGIIGIPKITERIYTEKEDGGRVYALWDRVNGRKRFLVIYDANGEFLRIAPASLDKYNVLSPYITDSLEKEFMPLLGRFGRREKIRFDDYRKWKSSMIMANANQKFLEGPKTGMIEDRSPAKPQVPSDDDETDTAAVLLRRNAEKAKVRAEAKERAQQAKREKALADRAKYEEKKEIWEFIDYVKEFAAELGRPVKDSLDALKFVREEYMQWSENLDVLYKARENEDGSLSEKDLDRIQEEILEMYEGRPPFGPANAPTTTCPTRGRDEWRLLPTLPYDGNPYNGSLFDDPEYEDPFPPEPAHWPFSSPAIHRVYEQIRIYGIMRTITALKNDEDLFIGCERWDFGPYVKPEEKAS